MCMGSDLSEIRIRDNGRRIASFLFAGADLNQLDKDYMNGTALVNPVQFRESLNRLRDIMFEKLREGRYENDRKRNHQGYQKRR